MRRVVSALALCLALAACESGTGGAAGGFGRSGGGGGTVTAGGADMVMAPGEVGRACRLSRRDRGVEVARFPTEGTARWRIYDTAPGSTRPRTQYITGFDDGCARQVTAALMVFGAPSVHEPMRYDPTNTSGFSATDRAYEGIKAAICGVRARTPCPSDRLPRLEDRTAFVTVYPTFGGSGRQLDLLLDEGSLVAQSKTGL